MGGVGERKACEFLRKAGYRIIARNWRTRFGEIDIIARDGETLVFVEVKLRSSEEFGGPEGALTPAKQRRIVLAARHFLGQTECELPVRFDLVTVVGRRIRVIRNAFWVE
jgi:putative endonuclease